MNLTSYKKQQASVLVITVVFCGLIGVVLVAYLSMVSGQHKFSHRSQVWNTCIPMCEAGVEEALAHLNYSGTTSNFAINGWVLDNNAFRKQRNMNDGTIKMAISNVNPPVIYAHASLLSPVQTNWLLRSVLVKTRINTRFAYGVLAKGTISMSGNSARVDSFNSTNALYSTLGMYDPLKALDTTKVVTTAKTVGAINTGNVSIYGYASTGPGGTVVVGSNGGVGDTVFNTTTDGKIQGGHVTDDANQYIPDAIMPTTWGPAVIPGSGIVNGTNYNYVLGNGDYTINTINMSSSDKMIITGTARIRVTGDTSLSGQAYILIANGGSVEWYSDGNMSLSGGGVVNAPGLAKNFAVYGLNTCTSIDYSGGSKFVGTIYAPKATIKMTGNSDASGAIVGNSVTISGGMSLHYDESLNSGPKGRYIASSWLEI